jgi:hypothetical protein
MIGLVLFLILTFLPLKDLLEVNARMSAAHSKALMSQLLSLSNGRAAPGQCSYGFYLFHGIRISAEATRAPGYCRLSINHGFAGGKFYYGGCLVAGNSVSIEMAHYEP